MPTRRIYTIGETVFDIIFKNGNPQVARPGGSMLNTSVSLGRLGLPVSFMSEIGDDEVGHMIVDFLTSNNVGTEYIRRHKDANTTIALAFLDEDDNAEYQFYKNLPKRNFPDLLTSIRKDDILLFGSFLSLTSNFRPTLVPILKQARDAGAIIIYDPNFRKPHLKKLNRLRKFIEENISYSNIVRGSCDDFRLIFNSFNMNDTYRLVRESGGQLVISTHAGEPVQLKSDNTSLKAAIPLINPVSTIGAGDSFNAGLIYSLYKLNIRTNDLSSVKKKEWETILETCIAFGTRVCESWDNYIPFDFADRLKFL